VGKNVEYEEKWGEGGIVEETVGRDG